MKSRIQKRREEEVGAKGKCRRRGQEERDEWQMVISRVGRVRRKSVIVILLYIYMFYIVL